MKKIFLLTIALLSFLILCCESPSAPLANNICHANGLVAPDSDEIWVGSYDIYHFGSIDKKTPYSEGFKFGDYVYFEYEPGWSNQNIGGGTTYWCKLLLIRKG